MDKYNVQVSDIVSATETTIVKETEGDVNIQINDENIDYTLNKFQELIRQNIIEKDFYNQFSAVLDFNSLSLYSQSSDILYNPKY